MEINNVDCPRLGTLLYLEIQKGKDATKKENVQQQIGGTAVYMKKTNGGYKRVWPTEIKLHLFVYSWFIGVKNTEQAMNERVDY